MNGLPVIAAQRRGDAGVELDLIVSPDNPWFEGHFPDQPILPGVVQIGWAVHFAGELTGFSSAVTALEQVKFKRPILPGVQLTLHLTPVSDAHKLRYEYREAAAVLSSGVLNFGTVS